MSCTVKMQLEKHQAWEHVHYNRLRQNTINNEHLLLSNAFVQNTALVIQGEHSIPRLSTTKCALLRRQWRTPAVYRGMRQQPSYLNATRLMRERVSRVIEWSPPITNVNFTRQEHLTAISRWNKEQLLSLTDMAGDTSTKRNRDLSPSLSHSQWLS